MSDTPESGHQPPLPAARSRIVRGAPPWEISQPAAGPPWEASQPAAGPPWPPAPMPPAVTAPAPDRPPPPPPERPAGSAGAGTPPGTELAPAAGPPRPAGILRTVTPLPAGGRRSGAQRPAECEPGEQPATASLPAVTGTLVRRPATFTGRITRDGSSGFPVQRARYQLYACLACPWSHRALIVRRLLGLDRVIGLTLADPVTDDRGWRLGGDGRPDPVTGARHVADLYRATDPDCSGPAMLPLIWDTRTCQVVSDDVAQITVMLETEFRPFHRPGAPDLYPAARRREIESLATLIFSTVNAGVYRAGTAATQEEYEQATKVLFTTLDALDDRLARRRFLLGDLLTEADVRLYPTLVRFDAVYHPLFHCNLRRLADYPHLWAYTRDLHSHRGFGETTDLDQIKRHYYLSAEWAGAGRRGIVPAGPRIDWGEPHGRARMPS